MPHAATHATCATRLQPHAVAAITPRCAVYAITCHMLERERCRYTLMQLARYTSVVTLHVSFTPYVTRHYATRYMPMMYATFAGITLHATCFHMLHVMMLHATFSLPRHMLHDATCRYAIDCHMCHIAICHMPHATLPPRYTCRLRHAMPHYTPLMQHALAMPYARRQTLPRHMPYVTCHYRKATRAITLTCPLLPHATC
jgi:hypothetical protein